MHHVWTTILSAVTAIWILRSARLLLGMNRILRLSDVPPLPDADCPSASVLFAARDEASKLPAALPTQLAQDYPSYEVIAVDDRSRDATGKILDDFARRHQNLKVLHVDRLPPGWVGKSHALALAYRRAYGEWLAFTDADVQFAPDLLRRALSLAKEQQLDHLTALPLIDTAGFWERTTLSYFVLGFVLAFEPWRVSSPRSRRYLSVGAFQLIRRSAYEAVGTHDRLAMEIADDTKLGKLAKQGGFRSGVARAEEKVRLRWQEGWSNIVNGLSKNFFAACGFRLSHLALKLVQILALSILPFLAVLFASGPLLAIAAAAVLAAVTSHAWAARELRLSPLYALTHPLGGATLCYLLLRSAALALLRRGVVWRETFYPLEQLRRGAV